MLEDKKCFVNKSNKIAQYYNQHAGSELLELFPGMKVLVQKNDDQSWAPGTIKEKCVEPRSYVIEMSNGSNIRRNRRFIKEISPKASSKFCFDKNSMCDDDVSVCEPVKKSTSNVTNEAVPKTTEVAFKDQAEFTYVRNDVPVKEAFGSRKTTCTIKKPCRLIENC